MATEIEDQHKQEIFNTLVLLGMKMASLWNIKTSYLQSLAKAKESVRPSPERQGIENYTLHSTELMGWADVYLVQIKSTLDHLVKVPTPVFGRNRWNLRTFGERGAKVKKAFDNLPREYKEKTLESYDSIFGEQHWIDDMIQMRDKLNHGMSGGGDPQHFRVSYDSASDKFYVPMWNETQELGEAIEIVFDLLLMTCSVFCATILELRLPAGKIVVCDKSIRTGAEPICKIEDEQVFAMKTQLRQMGLKVAE